MNAREPFHSQPRWVVSTLFAAILSMTMRSGNAADAIRWEPHSAGRKAPLASQTVHPPGFTLLSSADSGIHFQNPLPKQRYTTNQIILNGSGVAAGDVDRDGWCDLFFAGLDGTSRLYRNEGGWKFTDITKSAGLAPLPIDGTGVAFADLDGDGAVDLLLNSVGEGTFVFLNDGQGHFHRTAILNPGRCGTSFALADVDGDGDLDVYIANYRVNTVRDDPGARYTLGTENGKPAVLEYNGRSTHEPDLEGRFVIGENGRVIEKGEVDVLYLNQGKGLFEAVSFLSDRFTDDEGHPLTIAPHDWGLSAMFRDLNRDGLPDLYVCNDFESPDRIWMNQGGGHFRAMAPTAIRHTSLFSMGVDFADINRDGFDDFIVLDMLPFLHADRLVQIAGVPPYRAPMDPGIERLQYSRNTLFLNRGDATFAEVAWHAGLEGSGWSWTPIFLDVDLDGYEDLLITTGNERESFHADVAEKGTQAMASRNMSPRELLELNNAFDRLATPLMAFHNRGDGTFEEQGKAWGFEQKSVSQGMCLADLDNDGDMDVIVNALNEEAKLYRNDGSAPRVALRLVGRGANTAGIGARVSLMSDSRPIQSQEMIAGGRYLSSDQPQRVFAAVRKSDGSPNSMTLEIRWPDGSQTRIENVTADTLYEIHQPTQGTSASVPKVATTASKPLFEDVSGRLHHMHKEAPFDDFERQPMLPWRMSQLGPGVCWQDFDGDGWLDLAIGGGRGSPLGIYLSDRKGGFLASTNATFGRPLGRDLAGLAAFSGILVAGSSNYEDGTTNGGAVRIYSVLRGAGGESVLGPTSSTGPVAMADIDGDGDLDLFIGGRLIAGRFPQPADSQWLRNEGGRFVKAQRFDGFGLVSGVVFSDLDGDGDPDLVAACEWGALKFLRNDKGILTPWDPELRCPNLSGELRSLAPQHFSDWTGWWHGVAAGDFDGDGRMDFVASNWGNNSRVQATLAEPWILYFGDLADAGQMDLIEARREQGREIPQRTWRMVRSAFPFLMDHIAGHAAYASMSIHEIYQDRLARAQRIELRTSTSQLFLNRGDHFEAFDLPEEAQRAPAFGVSVGDMDGDGYEDVFLSQNFFPMNLEMDRQDAGRGLWLRGNGHGAFAAVSGTESGIQAYGEQRGCAVADFDNDGRLDLVVTQNNGETRLFRNQSASPGWRIVLKGATANAESVGAWIALQYADHRGPVREIHAGSGYWSQDGAPQILASPTPPTGVWVRWPGGTTSTHPLPPGKQKVEISQSTTPGTSPK